MGSTTYKCCPIFKQQRRRFHSWDDVPPPKDVGALFSQYAGEAAASMSVDGLRRYYLDDVDDTNIVDRLLGQIFRQQDQDGGTDGPLIPHELSLTDFFHHILFSHKLNPPITHEQHVHHDMTLPLSHYFIYTGYNPYHTRPNQKHGRCRSDDPIIRALKMALKMGVRAIDVAMWPGSSKEDDIVILHGWSRNTPVLLMDFLMSIKEYAFVDSPYPVIMTLEDNLLSYDLQKKAAKVVLDVLGDILYLPADHVGISYYRYRYFTDRTCWGTRRVFSEPADEDINPQEKYNFVGSRAYIRTDDSKYTYAYVVRGNIDSDNNHLKGFLSPEELKGRVLLSIKPPKPIKRLKVESKVDGKGADDDDAAWGAEVSDFQTSARKHDDDVSKNQRDDYDSGDDNENEQQIQPPQYQHLITIKGKQKGAALRVDTEKTKEENEKEALADALQSGPDEVRLLSWSKQKIEIAAKDLGTAIVRFTQRNILRIYPRGTRRTSSNYNPFLGWVHGAQMVALNMQGYGRALWLAHGFFKLNGGCGYVRKPDFLMQTAGPEVFDPRNRQPVKKTLKVKVYMGDGWRMDVKHSSKHTIAPDFWTRVGIAGVAADSEMKNTSATERSWVPVWEEEFVFPLTVPEMALLRVEVHQYGVPEKDAFAGQTVLPVSMLRPGIRAVPLLDRQGNLFANVKKLLMRFQFV